MSRLSVGGPARAWLSAAAAAAVGAAAIVVAVAAPGYPSASVRLTSDQVWLPSWSLGQVALVDGTTGQEVASTAAGKPGDRLSVGQDGESALLADPRTGQLLRLNAATVRADPVSAQPLAGAQVLTGARMAYAVSTSGAFVDVDPATGATVGPVGSLGHMLEPDAEAVDGVGKLWAIDVAGDIVGGGIGDVSLVHNAATPGFSRLVTVGAGVAIVDPVRRQVTELRTDGKADRKACLPAGIGAAISVVAAASSDRVLVASDATGSLVVADLATGGCSESIHLTSGHPSFGAPVLVGNDVFIPDSATGDVSIVSLATGKLLSIHNVLRGNPSQLQLISVGGVVFYNDPATQRAGLLRVDGTMQAIAKYDLSASATTTTATTTTSSAAATTTSTPPTSQGPKAEGLVISVSTDVAGQQATLQVKPKGNQPLTGAAWTFDDTSAQQTGLTVRHTWAVAGNHTISVTATTATGRIQLQEPVNVVPARQPSPPAPSATPTPPTTIPSPGHHTSPPVTHTSSAGKHPPILRQSQTQTTSAAGTSEASQVSTASAVAPSTLSPPTSSLPTSLPTSSLPTASTPTSLTSTSSTPEESSASPPHIVSFTLTVPPGDSVDLEDGAVSEGPGGDLSFAWVVSAGGRANPDLPCDTCGGGAPMPPPPPAGAVKRLAVWTPLNGALVDPNVTDPEIGACEAATSSSPTQYVATAPSAPLLGSSWCVRSSSGDLFLVTFDTAASTYTLGPAAQITVEE